MSSQKKQSGQDISSSTFADRKVILACIWLVFFFLIFFLQVLPNAGSSLTRMDIWKFLPELYLDLIFPPPEIAETTGWKYLPQRLDLILVAGLIYLAAWGAGNLILKLIRWDTPQNRAERIPLIFGLGLSALSLMTMVLGKCGIMHPVVYYVILGLLILSSFGMNWKESVKTNQPGASGSKKKSAEKTISIFRTKLAFWTLLAMSPFVLAMFLGSMLPSIDFDVREYHLQGPKEYYQNGYVGMLPHNVYTSFPFFTEILSLLGMILRQDWYRGAMCGKAVLMGFAPLTAVTLYAAGKRWFSHEAGWIAALVYLSTPWVYRISIIAYTEGGVAFFLFVSLFAYMLSLEKSEDPKAKSKGILITGMLAGSAMACKYPGVVQVVIPLGLAVLAFPFFQKESNDKVKQSLKLASIYSLGVLLTIGPWLMKNLVETGNPVYPLVYSVFGGEDWDEELNAKWKNGHSSKGYPVAEIPVNFFDVTVKSDWLSPLLFGLAPLSLLCLKTERKRILFLWLFFIYLFSSWWLLTHRIDRFWVPLIPVIALLAGVGFQFSKGKLWKMTSRGFLVLVLVYNLGYISTELCGYNGYLVDHDKAKLMTEGLSSGIQFINENLTDEDKVLCIGEAAVFDTRIPVVYNTVFDYSIFEEWFSKNEPGVAHKDQEFKSAGEIQSLLKEKGVTYLLVNWAEILRYRPDYSYGYTDFVMPERFEKLQEMGVIGSPVDLGFLDYETLPDEEQAEVTEWGTSLLRERDGKQIVISTRLYKVLD